MPGVPKLEWTWSPPTATMGILLPGVFEKWHRGHLLGMQIEELLIAGKPVDAYALECLNYWLMADGAWRASLLDHFEAEKILADILCHPRSIVLGPAGGGRWPATTLAKDIFDLSPIDR